MRTRRTDQQVHWVTLMAVVAASVDVMCVASLVVMLHWIQRSPVVVEAAFVVDADVVVVVMALVMKSCHSWSLDVSPCVSDRAARPSAPSQDGPYRHRLVVPAVTTTGVLDRLVFDSWLASIRLSVRRWDHAHCHLSSP